MIGPTALALHRAIRTWLGLYSGLADAALLPANHEEQHRPKTAHITIRVVGKSGRVEVADQRHLNADGSMTTRGGRRGRVQLQAFGQAAVTALDDLEWSRALPDVEEHLFTAGISIADISESLEQNADFEGVWESRSFREIRLTFIEQRLVAADSDHLNNFVSADLARADLTHTDFDDDDDAGIVAVAEVAVP